MFNMRRRLRSPVLRYGCQIEILQARHCLDTTLTAVVPIMLPPGESGPPAPATVTATQTHGPTINFFGDGFWYGQSGFKTDGSFTQPGPNVQPFKSFGKIFGGGAGGVCNTVSAGQEAGTVEVNVGGLTAGTKYAITVNLNASGSTIGPSTNVVYDATPMNVGRMITRAAGSDASGNLSVQHGNGPIPTGFPPSTVIMDMWAKPYVWTFEVTGGVGPLKVFRWHPTMSQSGNPTIL